MANLFPVSSFDPGRLVFLVVSNQSLGRFRVDNLLQRNMNRFLPSFSRYYRCFLGLVLLVASGCNAWPQTTPPAADVVVVETTQEVTRQVTVVVTRVLTKVVTATPRPTWEFTPTLSLSPTTTPTPPPPHASLLKTTDCLYGPADFYLYKTTYPAGTQLEVVGRSQDALWINVQEIQGWNSCWIPAENASLDRGQVTDLPFVYTDLPLTRYEYRPPAAHAVREGEIVTVSWEAVWMSKDELRGYLIEAWVCQNGQLVFLPIGIQPTYEENAGILSVQIRDESGCDQPSSAQIATASKRGYTLFAKIFWPPP